MSEKMKPSIKEQNAKIVGAALAEVLPQSDKWWFQQPHLMRLNLLLLIPLMSSSVSGFDGKTAPDPQSCLFPQAHTSQDR